MDFQSLKIFKEVANTGSFLSASKNVNYAQSHISTRMQQLESELGTSLFYRNNRGVTLTPKGELFLEYAEKMLKTMDDSFSAMRETDAAYGSLRIGSLETFSQMYLPTILNQYHRKNEKVSLSVTCKNSSLLLADILDRNLDIAVISGLFTHPDLTSIPYRNEEMVFVTAKSNQSIVEWEELDFSNICAYQEGCYYRATFQEFLRTNRIVCKNTFEFNSAGSLLANICAGLGVGYLPLSLIEALPQKQNLVTITPPETYRFVPTYIVYRTDHYLDKAFSNFLALFDINSIRNTR